MSRDRELDIIMEMDINPEGDIVDPNEQRFRAKYLDETAEQFFRLDPIDEGAVAFAFNEGDSVSVRGTPATIKECRGYRSGGSVVPRYLVEAEDGRTAEVDEAQIDGVVKPSSLSEAINEAKGSIAARMKKAMQDADDAFWEVIAKAFPEAKTGDFDPSDQERWEQAMWNAMTTWVSWNVPEVRDSDDPVKNIIPPRP